MAVNDNETSDCDCAWETDACDYTYCSCCDDWLGYKSACVSVKLILRDMQSPIVVCVLYDETTQADVWCVHLLAHTCESTV